jgi:two-component system, LytTR family, response regulator
MYRDFLQEKLSILPDLEYICVCEDAISTLKQLQIHTPDFLILDVEMPNLTGIQLVKSLKEVPPVIFITSHLSYAADAFDLDAVDYLVKPTSTERLIRAINKVRSLIEIKRNESGKEQILKQEEDSFFYQRQKHLHQDFLCRCTLYSVFG